MNTPTIVQNRPVLTAGVASAILLAAWAVIVDQGLLDGLTSAAQLSMSALVVIVVPVVANWFVQRFVTPIANPALPVGTIVNAYTDAAPTAVVTEEKEEPAA